jgi:hypothetical protein
MPTPVEITDETRRGQSVVADFFDEKGNDGPQTTQGRN